MWLLLVGCSYHLDVTGGGEVRVDLQGDDLEPFSFVVSGMSQAEIDALLFVDGDTVDAVDDNLRANLPQPDDASAVHVDIRAEWNDVLVQVFADGVDGLTPCGLTLRHVELYLDITYERHGSASVQFDERTPEEFRASRRASRLDPTPSLVRGEEEDLDFTLFGDEDDASGTGEFDVDVQCEDEDRSATLTVQWDFDPDVHRRAVGRD